MTTGQKIYELRKNARITQEQFAEQLGVSRQAVSKWESDAAYPETDKIIKMSELFGVSCDYLLRDGADMECGVLSRRRRSFLSMLVSFAVACCAAGYVVAVICYYCIDSHQSSLIGLGVLAAFLLAAFILWQVGRYRFLNECDYSEEDKSHLAAMTKMWYYAAIISLFCYLPAVATYGLTGMAVSIDIDAGYGGVEQQIFVYRYMDAGEFFLTLVPFAAAGYGLCRMCDVFHQRALGKTCGPAEVTDRIVLFLLCALAAAFVVVTIYCDNDFGLGNSDGVYDFDLLAGIACGIVMPAVLLVDVIIHRIYSDMPALLFGLTVACCACLACAGVFGVLVGWGITGWVFSTLPLALAVVCTVLVAVYTKKRAWNEPFFFRLFLPACLVAAVILTVQYNLYITTITTTEIISLPQYVCCSQPLLCSCST